MSLINNQMQNYANFYITEHPHMSDTHAGHGHKAPSVVLTQSPINYTGEI